MPQAQATNPQAELLIQRAQRVLPGGSLGNVYGDVVIREGRAGRVIDVDGNNYIDLLLGSGPMLLGHAHPEVVEAVASQVNRGTTFFANNEIAIALAERIVQASPCADKVRFTSSGTEANAYAMRAVRAFRGRDKILKFEGAFHGMSDLSLMSMAPDQPPDFPRAVPDSPGISPSASGEVLIAPFNNVETTTAIIEKHHDELAGVIVEPIQRLIPPKPGFLAALREVTQQYELPLIFDEVVTAFRFAYGGAQEYYGVVPDLCAMGKVVGGGFPLAAVAGREEIMACFDPAAKADGRYLSQIGTLSGNPVAAAAGLATLDVLQRAGTYERLAETGRQLIRALEEGFRDAGIVAQVVGEPAMFDVFFTDTPIVDYRSTLTHNKQMLLDFVRLLLHRGVFRGDLKFYVSTAHTQDDVSQAIEAFRSAIDELNRNRGRDGVLA